MIFDFVFIGSGHNALTCAAYLAKSGASVALFEKDNDVGGACRTVEVTMQGFRHDIGSIIHTNMPNSPIYRDLELEKYGVKYIYPQYPRATIFTDHRAMLMHRDYSKMADEISQCSKNDQKTFLKLCEKYGELVDQFLKIWMFSTPPPLSAQYSLLEGYDELLEWSMMSPIDLIKELFESEEVRVHFLTRVTVLGFAPHFYGRGLIALARILKAEAPVCLGGSNSLAQGLKKYIEVHGGKIFTNMPVKKIVVSDDEVEGVILNDGRYVEASKGVVSGVNPIITYLKLIGEDHLDKDFVRRVKRYHSYGRSLFALHLALKKPPNYKAALRRPNVNMAFSQEMFGDSVEHQYRAYHEIALGFLPRNENIQVTVPSIFDGSRAPPGYHVATVWQYAPYKLDGVKSWSEVRSEYAACVLDLWKKYTTNIDEDNVIAMTVQDPTNTEEIFPNLINGVDVVGDMTPDQLGPLRPLYGYSNYKGPLRRLYHAGGYCHPGGGVHGAAGYNAANVIADDYGLTKWWIHQ
jgi:phytoene dehydrogenase-like protein